MNPDSRPAALAYLARLRNDLPLFASKLLFILSKTGELEPLAFNRAQLHVHEAIQEQLNGTGKVRVLVLKGRQQGISTYVQARFYWRTSLRRGIRAYILTHRKDASEHLFAIAQRFHRHQQGLRPELGACNERELLFEGLESEYRVATAGAVGTGRSSTAQCFHGSEVAFWPNADDHMSGLAQVIPDLPGSEIILESTANGVGNFFHRAWQSAERKESDYRAIFVPWFWQPEYQRTPTGAEEWSAEEEFYRQAYGLTLAQLAWRRHKILDDFTGDTARFCQEYPATASEAFVAVGHEPFIPPVLVLAARGRKIEKQLSGLVVGVDPARYGKDSTCIVRRVGRECRPVERLRKRDLMHQAGRISILIREERPLRVFIDVGGLGAGLYDRLLELGYGEVVTSINFGETANRPDRFLNRRAEMWSNLRDWLAGARLPDDDILAGDLVGPKFTYDSEGRLKLESKEDMRKRGLPSPDSGDGLALTHAMPIAHEAGTGPGGQVWEDMVEAFREVQEQGLEGIHTG